MTTSMKTSMTSMTASQNRHFNRAAAALAILALAGVAATGSALAKTNFDGTWSVLIVTEKGDCDRAYRYPIRIDNGALVNAGSSAFDISGKVAGNGAVTVRVSHGSKSANGSGRLSAAGGSGSWSGGACAGTWEAERRS
jgi:hypothetical protein